MRSWRMWPEKMSWGRSLHQISSNTTMIVLLSNYNGPGIVKAMSPRSGNQWLSVAKWNKRDEKDPLSRFILHAFTFTRNSHLRNNPLLCIYFDGHCGRLSIVFLLILSTSLYMIRNAILLGFVYTNELEIVRKKTNDPRELSRSCWKMVMLLFGGVFCTKKRDL